MSYVDTFYSRTVDDNRSYPTLTGTVECDTCVIGGGLAGVTVALQLARAGRSVVILEGQRVGWGASGRNGGFVSPGYSNSDEAIARIVGVENAHKLYALSIEGAKFVRETIDSLNITSAQATPGIMSVRRYDDSQNLHARVDYLLREFDYSVEYMGRDEVQSMLHSTRYFQALRDPQAFHMHPLNYLRSIVREIEHLGGKMFETSAAMSSNLSLNEKIVRTAKGAVKAQHVVIATGGYTTRLVPKLKRSFLPIATYVMLTQEAPDLIRQAITTTDAVGDNRRAGDYYRVVEDGKRLLWGGRITTKITPPSSLASQLRREMVSTYPQLADLKIETSWSGLMSYARHLMPQIGQLHPGVWYCTAFGGHGLNTTAIGGKLVAEGILEQSNRYKFFEPFGLFWTGGAIGLSVAQLTYWKLQLQDRWQER